MVFHIIPALAVASVKYVIKEATDAPRCGNCGKEKLKMWAGFRIIFLCEDCEDGMKVKLGLKAVQIATFGVCLFFSFLPSHTRARPFLTGSD
jgi:hypothetical protein